jgi:NAD(P)-dependent dehydrogenase (short-subunit alcohol dehydrogenase family)
VQAFRDGVLSAHAADSVNCLFNNAGIGGGGSFLLDDRAEWEKTFGVCWNGVYHCSRAFLPLLVASSEGAIVNTSSVNGFWATLGPGSTHTAYSAAKFAVKGFTEALLSDCRLNAPHVEVFLVMPGHVGTSIVMNTTRVLGRPAPAEMTSEDLAEVRDRLTRQGMPVEGIDDDFLRDAIQQRMDDFRDKAPLSAADAATIILDGVRAGRWRILVGDDARVLDRMVRADPEEAYEPSFWQRLRASGHFGGVSGESDGDPSA